MKKFILKNMGCKSNQLEGALIEERLKNNNYEQVEKIEDADFFVLNSCTVTHKSDNEAFQILANSKKKNSKIKNILTGCIAQVEKDKLLENPNIDIILGNDEKLEIEKHLDMTSISDIMNLQQFHRVTLFDTKKTRANLKIQDGCDSRCSYCIIPFARGQNRSADVDFILNQIKLYEDAGFKEIVLTGIHIGQWGRDFDNSSSNLQKTNLLYLLQEIEEKTNIQRFRLGSLNPLEIDNNMIDFLTKSEKFCPHFHLSLQSMCNNTLKAMNRHYSVERAMDLIEQISESFKLPFIGSDVIAGFVGESEEDFFITVENLNKSKLTKIHTFPYSLRKGTRAESLDGHLPDSVKAKRASVIKDISNSKHSEFLLNNIGEKHEILVEKQFDKKTSYLKGMTRNYIEVLLNSSDAALKNTLHSAIIKDIDKTSGQILGELSS